MDLVGVKQRADVKLKRSNTFLCVQSEEMWQQEQQQQSHKAQRSWVIGYRSLSAAAVATAPVAIHSTQ